MHPLTKGLMAGAAGTAALNIATYGDMLLRGRPTSDMPAQVADRVVDRSGIALGDRQHRDNREQAAGALLGYVTGLGIAAGYGLLRGHGSGFPGRLLDGPLIGAVAMAGSDVPAAVLNVTDPASWSGKDWLSDIVPHLLYGITTAAALAAFDALS